MHWDCGEAWLPTDDDQFLQPTPAWYALNPTQWQAWRKTTEAWRWQRGEGLLGRVWQQRQPAWLADVASDPAALFLRGLGTDCPWIQTAIALPVVVGDRGVAVLVFYRLEARSVDPQLLGRVMAIAAQLAPLFELKQTQVALAKSQSQMLRLIDSLPGIVFAGAADATWSMRYMSQGCYPLTGYQAEELIGAQRLTTFTEITHPDDLPAVLETIAGAIAQHQPYVTEYRIRAKNGDEKWLWEKGYGVYDATGTVAGIEGFITDTTARRQAEEALRMSEARFRNLFYGATIGICYTRVPGVVGECNPAYEQMLGYGTAETRSLPIAQITHPDDLSADLSLYQELLDGQRHSYALEKRFIHRDGSMMWGKLTLFATRDALGTLQTIFAIVEDITQGKAAEAALQKSEAQSRQLLQAIPEMLFVFDAEGIYQYVQAEDPADLARPLEEILGQSLEQVLPPEVAAQARMTLDRVATTQQSQSMDYALSLDGELRYFEGRMLPYGKDAFVMTVRNISERKQAEKAIQDQEAFLRLILNSIPQHIFWKDTNLVYQGSNQVFAEGAGFDNPAEVLGKTDFDLWDGSQAELFQARDRQVLESRQPLLNTIRQKILPDGQVRWQNLDKVPIYDAQGDVIGVLGTFEDITEQRRIGESLARRQQYLSVLVDVQNYLLSTEDIHQVYPQVLATLGRISSASRVYLFENSWDAEGHCLMNQRQEWCGPGVAAQMDNPALQNFSYDDFAVHLEAHLTSGEAYMGVVTDLPESAQAFLAAQGILSILLLPLLVNESFYGFIGFDNCTTAQLWDPMEVDLLRAVAASLALALERQEAIATVCESEARYRLLAEHSNDLISRHSPNGQFLYVSPACVPLLGYPPADLIGQSLLAYVHPDDRAAVERMHEMALHADSLDVTLYSYRFRHQTRGYIYLETCSRAVAHGQTGTAQEVISVSRDITERHRANELLTGQKRVLELIARDRPLTETLLELIEIIQTQNPDSLPSIVMLDSDGLRMREAIASKLPHPYLAALAGIAIGPNQGTCGTAMYFGHTVISPDIPTDPLWHNYRKLVQTHGLRACWSSPIISSQGRVLGSFAMYYRIPHTPETQEIQLIEMARQMAAIAIEQKRANEALQRAEAEYRGIFENAVEGIFQSTVEGQYTIVNPMLASIYGYASPQDLIASMLDIRHQLYVQPQRREEFVREMEEQGILQGFESQVYRKDGSIIWISECARALRNDLGQIIGYEGTVEDITQRKQSENELIRRDNLLQGVAEATHHLLTNAEFAIAIQKVLAILGEAAGVDRTYLHEHHSNLYTNDVYTSIRYEWTQPPTPPLLDTPRWHKLSYRTAQLEPWHQTFIHGHTISGITRHLSAAEQAVLSPDQVLSTIRVPIFVTGQLWGHIGFDDCATERHWTASEESMLMAIAASIGGAIQRQCTEEQMRYQAFHDSLTGLPNRVFYDHRLDLTLAHARRAGETFAVMFLDLDRFKTINDTLGHAVGDDLLRLTTQRLTLCLREEDTIARWGGDEFTLLLPNLVAPEDAAKVARRIAEALKPVFRLEGHDLHITCSLGIAIYPQDGQDANTLLKHADVALYRAKEEGRNNYQFYTAALNSRASERLTLDNSLHQALDRNEFVLYYQPQCHVRSGSVIQMEALIRWQHPTLGLLSPQTFIPLAEENGLIVPIGDWVMQNACAQAKHWHDIGFDNLRIAVNLSAHQFQQPNLVERVIRALTLAQLDPSFLEIEITETIFMKDVESARALLTQLRAMNVRVALDDFGTGYSSMRYLREFPLTTLKIDRAFTQDLPGSSQAIAIIDAIITLGHGLNLGVVAEGVETLEQMAQLQALRCEEMQGYLFSKPISAAAATQYLLQQNSKPTFQPPLES